MTRRRGHPWPQGFSFVKARSEKLQAEFSFPKVGGFPDFVLRGRQSTGKQPIKKKGHWETLDSDCA